jgi:hypothetical protein
MKDSLEDRKFIKQFRLFITLWLKTGYEWYQKDPKLVTSYKFGHDWNSDYGYKKYKKEIPNLPSELENAIYSTVKAFLVSEKLTDAHLSKIINWLESNVTICKPNAYATYNKLLDTLMWVMYHQLKQVEELD